MEWLVDVFLVPTFALVDQCGHTVTVPNFQGLSRRRVSYTSPNNVSSRHRPKFCSVYYRWGWLRRLYVGIKMLIMAQYGRPFIILREQAKKTRSHGIQAIKVRFWVLLTWFHSQKIIQSHILAAKTVSNIIRTSLGPRGTPPASTDNLFCLHTSD